jgi:hypothetical protein
VAKAEKRAEATESLLMEREESVRREALMEQRLQKLGEQHGETERELEETEQEKQEKQGKEEKERADKDRGLLATTEKGKKWSPLWKSKGVWKGGTDLQYR